jgi:hypothetical protein
VGLLTAAGDLFCCFWKEALHMQTQSFNGGLMALAAGWAGGRLGERLGAFNRSV